MKKARLSRFMSTATTVTRSATPATRLTTTVARLIGILAIVLGFSSAAHASFFPYERMWPQALQQYFNGVNATATEGDTRREELQCRSHFTTILNKGEMDIHYALGYFDESVGNRPGNDAAHFSPSLDGISFDLIRNFMKKPCDAASGQKLCGFQEDVPETEGLVVLTKTLKMYGKDIDVRMVLTHASASESYFANKAELREKQAFLTLQSEENYFGGLRDGADVVFYNGHSRNGGGPDFNPPVLRKSDSHPDYKGYYEIKRIGIKAMLSNMGQNANPSPVVGMFSCYSRQHFVKSLSHVKPHARFILTEGEIPYDYTVYASLGYLEGLLRGQCGDILDATAKQYPMMKRGFVGQNL